MKLPFEPAVLQYLIVIITALAASTAVGLKRGWRGQLMAFVPILAIWGLLGVRREALVAAVNTAYRGLLFFTACGTQTDTGSCLESSGVAAAMLVDPGRPPTSLLQRLMGAVLGVANGFTLSYLLLPMLPYRQQINLPIASTAAEEELPNIAQGLPVSFNVPQVSVAAVVLVFFVVFVILAVRLMRPTEV